MNKQFFKNSMIYVVGDVLNKALPFLLLPILTRYLTPADYGIVSVFGVFVSILAVFTGLSIHGAINVNYFKMHKDEIKVFIGNCVLILNVTTIITLIIIYIFKDIILEYIKIEFEWVIVAVILAFAQFLTTINLLLWTVEQKAKVYSLYQIAQTVTITILSILLIVGFGMKWEGQLLAMTIGTLIFSIISIVFIVKRGYLIFKPQKEYIKDALAFGIPLIPHALGGWIKIGMDRIMLMSILGASAAGTYAVGLQISMVISIVATAFNKAWSPYMFKVLTSEPSKEEKIKIVKFTYMYFFGITLLAIVFSIIINYITPYFLGEKFIYVNELVPYLTIAFSFQGMYYMLTNYIFFVKKTKILAYITFGTAIIHIFLLFILVKMNGMVGAAQASLISFLLTFFIVWYLANKIYQMPWKFW